MPTYTCLCCGHSETLESAEAAHHASWDVAPYFTLQPLCDLCMSAPILILGLEGAWKQHAATHHIGNNTVARNLPTRKLWRIPTRTKGESQSDRVAG